MKLSIDRDADVKKIKELFQDETYITIGNIAKLSILAIEIDFGISLTIIGTFADLPKGSQGVVFEELKHKVKMPWSKLSKNIKSELVKLILI